MAKLIIKKKVIKFKFPSLSKQPAPAKNIPATLVASAKSKGRKA